MRMRNWAGMAGLAIVAAWPFGGCRQAFTQPTVFELTQGLGEFDVLANTPVDKSRLVTLDTGGSTLGSGSLQIDPSVITITPTASGGGKIQLNQQGTSQLIVTAWVGTVEELTTVFDAGDEYGPYTVTLDTNNVPVSVSPSSINLTDKTIGLLNGGQFSLGLRVLSPIDGMVTIGSLTFNLGL